TDSFANKIGVWTFGEQAGQTVWDSPADLAYSKVLFWHARAFDPTTTVRGPKLVPSRPARRRSLRRLPVAGVVAEAAEAGRRARDERSELAGQQLRGPQPLRAGDRSEIGLRT